MLIHNNKAIIGNLTMFNSSSAPPSIYTISFYLYSSCTRSSWEGKVGHFMNIHSLHLKYQVGNRAVRYFWRGIVRELVLIDRGGVQPATHTETKRATLSYCVHAHAHVMYMYKYVLKLESIHFELVLR